MGSSTNSPGAMWWRSFKQILIFHTWVGFPFHERMIRVVTSSVKFLKSHLYLQQPRSSSFCPGFGWDRVNFHKKPGRDTAGPADPNWPNKGVFATMCPHGVAQHWGGSWLGGGELQLGSTLGIRRWALFCEFPCSRQCYCCYCYLPLLFCETVLTLTREFCLFLPILPHPTREKANRAASWSFVASRG